MAPETDNPGTQSDVAGHRFRGPRDDGEVAPGAGTVAAYIAGIGERTRGLRAERGMSRKELSRQSGISERYLAQLESGRANISVTLLWQIAEAMNVAFTEMLPSADTPAIQLKPLATFLERLSLEQQKAAYAQLRRTFIDAQGPAQGIALLGLRGGGKTTLGQRLAEALDLPFVRVGDVIEQLAGMKIAELFSLGGQKGYRRLEHQAVRQLIDSREKVVLETGGSLVSEQGIYNDVLSAFYTVWIKASPEAHMQRVVAQGDLRPMRDSKEAMGDLRRILAERDSNYSAANYVLDTTGRSVDDCLRELLAQCCDFICGESSGEDAGAAAARTPWSVRQGSHDRAQRPAAAGEPR